MMTDNHESTWTTGDVVLRALDRVLDAQQPAVAGAVERLRLRHQDDTPSELCRRAERRYIASVAGAGAAVGATAAAPGVGTGVALALTAGETVASLEASAILVLSTAEIHGIAIADVERRRTLMLAILVGDGGPAAVQKAAGRVGPHWARLLVDAVPMAQIAKINKVLGARFVTKYGTKQGVLVLGRVAPFGIGIGLGAAGNAAVGWSVVRGVRRAFGPCPGQWPGGGEPNAFAGAVPPNGPSPSDDHLTDDTERQGDEVDDRATL